MQCLSIPGPGKPGYPEWARELFVYRQPPQKGVVQQSINRCFVSLDNLSVADVMKLVALNSNDQNWNVAIMRVGADQGFKEIDYRLPRDPKHAEEPFKEALRLAGKSFDTRIWVFGVVDETVDRSPEGGLNKDGEWVW